MKERRKRNLNEAPGELHENEDSGRRESLRREAKMAAAQRDADS